jgi:hypothetical protein
MKFSLSKIRAIVTAPILALSACTFTKLMTTPLEKPTFTYTGSELV